MVHHIYRDADHQSNETMALQIGASITRSHNKRRLSPSITKCKKTDCLDPMYRNNSQSKKTAVVRAIWATPKGLFVFLCPYEYEML